MIHRLSVLSESSAPKIIFDETKQYSSRDVTARLRGKGGSYDQRGGTSILDLKRGKKFGARDGGARGEIRNTYIPCKGAHEGGGQLDSTARGNFEAPASSCPTICTLKRINQSSPDDARNIPGYIQSIAVCKPLEPACDIVTSTSSSLPLPLPPPSPKSLRRSMSEADASSNREPDALVVAAAVAATAATPASGSARKR